MCEYQNLAGQWYRHARGRKISVILQLRQHMMKSSNGNIFRVTGHLCMKFTGHGEFPAQKPMTRILDVCFDLHLN